MNDITAKKFIDNVFSLILKSRTIKDLEKIPDTLNISPKNRFKSDIYPKIEFEINKENIQSLVENKILDKEYNFTHDLSSKLEDPLTKLLYAALKTYKNWLISKDLRDDLKKIPIIRIKLVNYFLPLENRLKVKPTLFLS